MDTVLIVIGVLGLGAVVIAAYVFTVTTRDYVSENIDYKDTLLATRYIARTPHERRSVKQVEFPITVNGIFVQVDRRFAMDRRAITT
jgi:hypothetical protein